MAEFSSHTEASKVLRPISGLKSCSSIVSNSTTCIEADSTSQKPNYAMGYSMIVSRVKKFSPLNFGNFRAILFDTRGLVIVALFATPGSSSIKIVNHVITSRLERLRLRKRY